MKFAPCRSLVKNLTCAARKKSGNVNERKNAAREKKDKLNGISPDDGLNATDIGVKKRQHHKQKYGPQNRVVRQEPKRPVAQHELDGNAGET